MAYKGLREFVETLERAGELVRIKTYVDPVLEMTEITDRVSKNDGPALLFENTGTPFPVLINSMGSYKRMCMAMGVNHMDDVTKEIEGLFHTLTAPKESLMDKLKLLPTLGKVGSWMPKVISGKGKCQEVIITENIDIFKLPVMKCWPQDGNRFITLPIIHTKDPLTGNRNVGMYRMQLFEPTMTALHWHLHKVSRRHFNEYKKMGKKMPVAVALGGDPIYTYAATAPLPDGIDEYILAGFIRKKKVELVKCITQPEIEVPADADFIIEGYVDPTEDLIWEGPFGDHTGYYSLPDYYPRFHITAITHRKDAIYPSTIVGIPPQEDAWIGKATERIFLAPIKMTMVPEIMDMILPIEGVFHNLAIVQINKTYPGQALKVMNSLWGAGQMMFTKMMLVVDQHTNINDYQALAQYVSENVDMMQDIIITQGPTDVLDHSCSVMAFGGKLGIDGTKKFPEEVRHPNLPNPNPAKFPFPVEEIKTLFPEIKDINADLLKLGISCVFIAVEKNRRGHVKQLAQELFKLRAFNPIKAILFLDGAMQLNDIQDNVWRFSNNADVKRDTIIIEPLNDDEPAHIAIDGTRKTKALDGFQRDWPNILVSDDETIEKIDQIWDQLGLGKFLPSPSRKYKPLMYGQEAVAAE
jgi:4-hydroxy-3-polyprenylbenzoate decarboxylase